MDKITKGTWIIDSTKHLLDAKPDTLELNSFEVTEQAGKAGILLGRLTADKQEIISGENLKLFARQSGISPAEIFTYVNYLKNLGQVDFSVDSLDRIQELEIYCFSMENAIETTSDLFDRLNPSSCENANILALQSTYELPRSRDELLEGLTSSRIAENVAKSVLELEETFGIIKTSKIYDDTVFYNEYAFTGDVEKIQKAIKNLDSGQRDTVDYVLDKVMNSQGLLADRIEKDADPSIIQMMEGVGLLDGISVESKFGKAVFYTTPQIKGQSVGKFKISDDVFHKAKLLLSCLRYGQMKSTYERGRISTNEKMINIINKLIRGDWVGPCTAIGQDYQLLELDGVISTRPQKNGMYDMKLRQKEVGNLVKQMLVYNKVVSDTDDNILGIFKQQPTSYVIPEVRKKQIEANLPKPVADYREKMLASLRTGGRI